MIRRRNNFSGTYQIAFSIRKENNKLKNVFFFLPGGGIRIPLKSRFVPVRLIVYVSRFFYFLFYGIIFLHNFPDKISVSFQNSILKNDKRNSSSVQLRSTSVIMICTFNHLNLSILFNYSFKENLWNRHPPNRNLNLKKLKTK